MPLSLYSFNYSGIYILVFFTLINPVLYQHWQKCLNSIIQKQLSMSITLRLRTWYMCISRMLIILWSTHPCWSRTWLFCCIFTSLCVSIWWSRSLYVWKDHSLSLNVCVHRLHLVNIQAPVDSPISEYQYVRIDFHP